MDWILTKLDGFWRSGCGRLAQDVVNLPNAREHLERGWFMWALSTIGVLLTVSVPIWTRIVAAFCLLAASILQAELLITELRQHSIGDWWRVFKYCLRLGDLTPVEINIRNVGGPLDGLTDLFWKALTGLSLTTAIVIIVVGML